MYQSGTVEPYLYFLCQALLSDTKKNENGIEDHWTIYCLLLVSEFGEPKIKYRRAGGLANIFSQGQSLSHFFPF